jgi:hypothetical protein
MKLNTYLRIACMAMIMLLVTAVQTFAQVEHPYQLPALPEWFGQIDMVTTGIIVIGGWLTKYIPGISNVLPGTFRVLAFAILVAIGALIFGKDIWVVALNYFFATSMYEVIINPVTKKTVEAVTGEEQPKKRRRERSL